FYYWDNSWGCLPTSSDSICIEQITVNWVTKKGTINANYQHLITAPFNSNFSNVEAFDNIVPQPGNNVSNLLASTDGYFGYRIAYLRWSSYNSAVMQFPVNTGTLAAPIASIRWFELRQDTTTKLWSIYQQSTFGPADGLSRWEGAIAMNQNGDIGMEYSVSGPDTVYPSIRYTGRKYCDPLNSMTLAEGVAASGNTIVTTPQNPGNRWGDYSHLSVDPSDGITFWGTNMYAEAGAGNGINAGTRVFSFQVPSCIILDVPNADEPNEALAAYQDGGTLNVKGSNLPLGERVVVELFDVNGKTLMQKAMVTSASTLETSFNVASLAKALYIVRIGNDSFQRVVKLTLN
ncbi:MAG TPA: T9SS type A sorting domain-containing protein, partial [Bacteroidia bacterium]|nr:T9SS type A sorting domain-containing protein [Bacteroidia bacterium]